MSAEDNSDIEYSLWAYYHPKLEKSEEAEHVGTIADMDAAFKKAEALSSEKDYYKVEVKKKYFEPKTARELDMVIKVFEKGAKKPMSLLFLVLLTLVCGAAAFGIAFVLGQSMNAP